MRLPPLPDHPATTLARAIASVVAAHGGRTFCVGGCVRDRVMGLPVGDLDLEVFGIAPELLAELTARVGKVDAVGRDFGILKVTKNGATIDVALPRTERKTGVGHRGFAVAADPLLDPVVAASRRDLTMNAILEDLTTGEVLDPWGGIRDIEQRVLRHVSSAFAEDPLRVLRVVRFAARLEFTVAPETLALCRSLDLFELAAERVAEEFEKWLSGSRRPGFGLEAFVASGAFRLAPEIGFTSDDPDRLEDRRLLDALASRLDRAAAVRDELADPNAFMLGVLFGSAADSFAARKASLFARLDGLARGHAQRDLALAILREWDGVRQTVSAPPGTVISAPVVRRLALRLPTAIAWRLLVVDGDSTNAENLRRRAAELGLADSPPIPWVLGRDLLTLGATPGKAIGEMLDQLFQLQIDERVADRAAALDLARGWIASGKLNAP